MYLFSKGEKFVPELGGRKHLNPSCLVFRCPSLNQYLSNRCAMPMPYQLHHFLGSASVISNNYCKIITQEFYLTIRLGAQDFDRVIVDEGAARVNYLNNRVFLSRNYRLIVAPRKFDVLKTNICPRSEASRANMLVFRT